ncbi:hypothetical protein O181_058531 [Austropuccinia psidii MF-1]|uniref:Integrase catalytic domain-containing protein n=1 Tax=Austropuccinia psidii MF-1 TaxID=1389203 RepID=A0A9Q3HUX9_9BASI|nr:hypothetical protein [Austropuccinia psidii MF-1]
MLHSIAKPLTDVKRQINPLEKRLGNIAKIQEPRRPWEIVHMDWVRDLPSGSDRRYNAFLVIVDRFSKTPIFLPCHKDDTAMDTDLLIWNRVVSWPGIFTKVMSHRDLKLTSALWTILTSCLGQRIALHAIIEKGWNPKSSQDSLRKDLVELNPKSASFKGMLYKARKHEIRCMKDSFAYAKDKWDKSHETPDFKVGDLVLVSTTGFKSIKGCKKLEDSFAGIFVIKALHGENAV